METKELFELRLKRFKQELNVKTDAELAEKIGVSLHAVKNAKRKNSLPSQWYIHAHEQYGVCVDRVLSGDDHQMTMDPEVKELVGIMLSLRANKKLWFKLGHFLYDLAEMLEAMKKEEANQE